MKNMLVVIDMQNDFIDGVLGTHEAQTIVPKVAAKIKEYKNRGDVVIFTRDTHYEDYLNTPEGKKLPVPHCIAHTEGWQIHSDLETKGSTIIDKLTFGSIILGKHIDWFNPKSIEIVGLCTDICVISNAMILKAFFHEVPITVDASCCAGVTPESHKNALAAMKMCQIDIVNE